MMSTEIVIMQHGQAACDLSGIVGGERGDTGLTRDGRRQAALRAIAMGDEADKEPFVRVYSGSRPRQRETARIVAAVLAVPLHGDQALICQRYGHELDEQPWAEVYRMLGGAPSSVPDASVGRGGESWNKYVARLAAALKRLIALHPGQRIIVVGDIGHVDGSLRLFAADQDQSGLGGGSARQPAGLTCWRELPHAGQVQAAGIRWCLLHHGTPLGADGEPATGFEPAGEPISPGVPGEAER